MKQKESLKGIGLESIVDESKSETAKTKKFNFKEYMVDTSSAWMFYNPLMASVEAIIAGMDYDEILKSRLCGSIVHAVAFRGFAKFKRWYAKKLGITPEDPKLKKFFVDLSHMLMTQTPSYTTILLAAGASIDEMLAALPAGLAIGLASAVPYGYFSDKWRKLWNIQPILYN